MQVKGRLNFREIDLNLPLQGQLENGISVYFLFVAKLKGLNWMVFAFCNYEKVFRKTTYKHNNNYNTDAIANK